MDVDKKLQIFRNKQGACSADTYWVPRPGEHVLLAALSQYELAVRADDGAATELEIGYVWPRKQFDEALKLAWRHYEQRLRRARVTDHYPCCGGLAVFQPPWLALATRRWSALAEGRKCPHCGKRWDVAGMIEGLRITQVRWSPHKPRHTELSASERARLLL